MVRVHLQAPGGALSARSVALAATPAAIRQGLAGTPAERAGEGMLFDLRLDWRPHIFTTVGMLFPLDFALLREGRVVGAFYGVGPGRPAVFNEWVEWVLETPAGRLPAGLIGGRYAIGE